MARTLALRGSRIAGWSAITLLVMAGRSVADEFPPVVDLALLNGTEGVRLFGAHEFDHSARSVALLGDVNHDGHADIAIGAPDADPHANARAGEARIVFGAPGIGASGSLDLLTLSGADGFTINGVAAEDRAAFSVRGSGDVNGDGIDDIIIGARYADPAGHTSAGAAYIVFGAAGLGASGAIDLSTLSGADGFTLRGIDAFDFAGWTVAAAGDINNDGIDDLLVCARQGDLNGVPPNTGKVFVVFGAPDIGASGAIELSSLTGATGFVIHGVAERDSAGMALAALGDVNGDGIDDIAVGAHLADPGALDRAGSAYIVFGASGIGASGDLELSTLDGSNGFAVHGLAATASLGAALAGPGDINVDGVNDILIGAPGADPGSAPGAGVTYAIFGAPSLGASGTFDTTTITNTTGVIIRGHRQRDAAGTAVAGAGDINHDGFEDILIGAPHANAAGSDNTGRAYIVYGGPAIGYTGPIRLQFLDGLNGFTMLGAVSSGRFGESVAPAGDIDLDGVDDILIGAPESFSNGRPQAGEAFILFGRAPVCVADLNADGSTNAADFTIFATAYGTAVPPGTGADLNGDGLVNAADFVIFAGDFGCGP